MPRGRSGGGGRRREGGKPRANARRMEAAGTGQRARSCGQDFYLEEDLSVQAKARVLEAIAEAGDTYD